jgi:carotenoid cleavage dioxygenase
VIDTASGTVTETQLDDRGQEFPRVADSRVGRRHRYGYVPGLSMGDAFDSNGLIKHDFDGRTAETHDFGVDRKPGEFVFVAAADGSDEDDGYLMGFVYDRGVDRSDLEILDARDLTRLASVHLPVRVPFGFHGNWIAD